MLGVLAFADPVDAQQTRQEDIEKQRTEKAKSLEPYKPGKLESIALYMEDSRLLEKLQGPNVIFPVFGLGGDTAGAGFAGGILARHKIFGDHGSLRGLGAVSIRSYYFVAGQLVFPRLAGDHLELGVGGRYRYYPQQDFYGLGPNSTEDERSDYLFESTDYSGWATVRPTSWFQVGTRIWSLQNLRIGTGTDSRFPSTEEVFTPVEAPGINEQPDYLQSDGFIAIDYRDQPGNPRKGGLYRTTWSHYDDRDFNRYSFNRFEAVLQQYIPIFDRKRVFAFRGSIITTDPVGGQAVPFYFQPSLGGARFLRGYPDFRFRDLNAVTLTGEYRWEAFAGLDMALFYETGEVGPTRRQLDFKNFKHDYGIGFRFNTFRAVFLRFEVARGDEGTRLFAAFSNVF